MLPATATAMTLSNNWRAFSMDALEMHSDVVETIFSASFFVRSFIVYPHQ